MESCLFVLVAFAAVKYYVYGLTACPDNWMPYHGSCYYFSREIFDFKTAEAYCKQMSSHLVQMNTRSENEFIKKQVQGFQSTSWWIGLSDRLQEGVFIWINDQSSPGFSDWWPGEPNDKVLVRDEDCVTLYKNYNFKWSDYNCTAQTSHPLCEMKGKDATNIGGVVG